MQIEHNIPKVNDQKTIKDFMPLVFGFFGGLLVLSIYQNLRLYFSGVLDSFFNKSFLLLLLHHTGYTAIVTLVLVFIFNFLELKKSNKGFTTARIILLVLLGVEGLLVAYYVQNYEILGADVLNITQGSDIRFFMLPIVLMLLLTALIFHFIQKATAGVYKLISRMYPFTIIVFSLFLATLNSDKKPINENKTQHLVQSIASTMFDFNEYDGDEEYPLLHKNEPNDVLGSFFQLKSKKPNLVFIIVEGLGKDFIGETSRFSGFSPELNKISKQSLVWNNFVSNTGTSFATVPMLIGSLPFGKNGFTHIDTYTSRHTLFSILKKNGYQTSFNYGGNTALHHIDRFLDQESVTVVLDKKAFGSNFVLPYDDASGKEIGYADGQLFKRWFQNTVDADQAQLDVFLTMSTKSPYKIPYQKKYETQVKEVLSNNPFSEQAKRIIRNNTAVFASILYADNAVSNFLNTYKSNPKYNNTIFIITGSHNNSDLPQTNALRRYQVPFMIYSPLLKSPETTNSLASHADVAPSILALLQRNFKLEVPQQVAWLGNSLMDKNTFNPAKEIPLFRDRNNIQDFILGNQFLSSGNRFELNTTLEVLEVTKDFESDLLTEKFNDFKAINAYVTSYNKLIPANNQLANVSTFSKSERVWIESVFNGTNVDNAYKTARKLAFDKKWDRSILLCRYILSKTPSHADTEILMGRIYAWQQAYSTSESILKEAIRKYPKYEDAYAAILDTFYWAEQNTKALDIIDMMNKNNIESQEIQKKIIRAKAHISKESAFNTINSNG